jgi:hypothetical protein
MQSLLVFINLSLSLINLYGFYKCSGGKIAIIQNTTRRWTI